MAKAALVIIDVQNDFCPGGALPVPEGNEVIPAFNRYIGLFTNAGLPVYATRDWHPAMTHHFKEYGGLWPPHCVQGSRGSEFHPDLQLPQDVEVVSAGTDPNEQGYSGFEGRNDEGESLEVSLRGRGVTRVYTGGLATDYCVKHTSLDALARGFDVTVLEDAIKGIDVQPGDSRKALDELVIEGAEMASFDEVAADIRERSAASR